MRWPPVSTALGTNDAGVASWEQTCPALPRGGANGRALAQRCAVCWSLGPGEKPGAIPGASSRALTCATVDGSGGAPGPPEEQLVVSATLRAATAKGMRRAGPG